MPEVSLFFIILKKVLLQKNFKKIERNERKIVAKQTHLKRVWALSRRSLILWNNDHKNHLILMIFIFLKRYSISLL